LALLGGVAVAGCGLAWSGWLIVERGGPLPRITGTLVAIGGGVAAAAAAWLMVETLRGTL